MGAHAGKPPALLPPDAAKKQKYAEVLQKIVTASSARATENANAIHALQGTMSELAARSQALNQQLVELQTANIQIDASNAVIRAMIAEFNSPK